MLEKNDFEYKLYESEFSRAQKRKLISDAVKKRAKGDSENEL